MTCEDFHARIAELALDTLERGAARELEAHLAEPGPHAGCAELAVRFRAAALAPGLALDPVPPPASLWRSIEVEIAPPAPPRLSPVALALLAASVLAALAALALWRNAERETLAAAAQVAQLRESLRLDQGKRIDAEQGILTAKFACDHTIDELKKSLSLDATAVALLQQPGTQVVAFAPQPTHPELKAAALYNPKTGRALVIATGLPAIAGRDYQLWVIRGKAAPLPAGLIKAAGSGSAIVQGEVDPSALGPQPADALAISIEPTGGSKTPTDVAMVAGLHS